MTSAADYNRNALNDSLSNWQMDNLNICLNKDAMFLLKQNGGATKTTLKTMTRDELYTMAKSLSVKGRSKMNKSQLVEALNRKIRNHNHKK